MFVEVDLHCVRVMLLCLSMQMASTIGSIQASGLLVRARQVCAAPQTRPMRMAVGQWHEADVPVVVKGTRPPMKVRMRCISSPCFSVTVAFGMPLLDCAKGAAGIPHTHANIFWGARRQTLTEAAKGSWRAGQSPATDTCVCCLQMYTDLKAELEDVQGAFCPGLEAPFGQLNIAFKRLVTPNALNPDGTVPPSTHPGLPWWDMMRYMWRGVASVRVRNLTAVLANTLNPHVRPRDERLALTAATLSILVAAGKIDMTTTNITAHAHALPPDASLGECWASGTVLFVVRCLQHTPLLVPGARGP